MTIFERVDALEATVEAQAATILSMEETLDQVLTAEEDTGWIDLPLAGNVQAYSEELKPKYRKIGNIVFLSGVVKNITAENTVIGTLPEGFRPIRQSYFVGGSSSVSSKATFFNCQVNGDGNIRTTTNSVGTYNANYYLRLSATFSIN